MKKNKIKDRKKMIIRKNEERDMIKKEKKQIQKLMR